MQQVFAHSHVFDEGSQTAERSTRWVMWITAAMMVVEIGMGLWSNSMALLADGWHMSSHALAIGLAAFAYAAARRLANDERFAFGTWKIEVLAGFASAVVLLGIAMLMAYGSVERFFLPQPIDYPEAIAVAVVGLAVNVLSAFILGHAHHDHHEHEHGRSHDHGAHHHQDLNLKSAYLHVIADAATSVLAIGALVGGLLLGWAWLDPLMGIVGGALVAIWAWGLLKQTSRVLLDREMDHPVVAEVREVVAEHPQWQRSTQIADLHVWRVGKSRYACILSLVTTDPTLSAMAVRQALAAHEELVHVTVEIHHQPASVH